MPTPSSSPTYPEICVYMTVRNGLEYLPAALDSVRVAAARYPSAVELVVVDDGSTDGSADFMHAFAEQAETASAGLAVKVVLSGGIGRKPALNVAWRSGTAPLVANLDCDDLFHPDKLLLQGRVMAARHDIGILSTGSVHFGQSGCSWTVESSNAAGRLEATPADNIPLRDLRRALGRSNPINHSSVLMRRDILEAVDGYREEGVVQEDYDLWIRAAVAGFGVWELPLPLAGKRLHAAQSFEAGARLSYVLASYRLQRGAIRDLALPLWYHGVAMLRVAYRMLPQTLRGLRRGIQG